MFIVPLKATQRAHPVFLAVFISEREKLFVFLWHLLEMDHFWESCLTCQKAQAPGRNRQHQPLAVTPTSPKRDVSSRPCSQTNRRSASSLDPQTWEPVTNCNRIAVGGTSAITFGSTTTTSAQATRGRQEEFEFHKLWASSGFKKERKRKGTGRQRGKIQETQHNPPKTL